MTSEPLLPNPAYSHLFDVAGTMAVEANVHVFNGIFHMADQTYQIQATSDADFAEIEHLLDRAFGLARQTRVSYRLREGERPVPGLSFVVKSAEEELAGSISFWRVCIGHDARPALLLGPLAVEPCLRNRGLGLKLMRHGLAQAAEFGHELVLLVGDEPYYARAGFQVAPPGRFIMPGPVDPRRLLYRDLKRGAVDNSRGLVLPPGRVCGRGL